MTSWLNFNQILRQKDLNIVFLEIIRKNKLFNKSNKLLLALSGGIDSVVLFHLLVKNDFKFSVAHANFQLRGTDSEKDEDFVGKIAKQNEIELFTKRFDVLGYVKTHNNSIEMAARKFRYRWFEELSTQKGFDKILTAHHANDQVETILLNLTKGTGIRGLRGMKAVSGNIVRPLLFVHREEIKQFAKANRLKYREDISNTDIDFQRNFIRHKVVPLLKELNPSLEQTITKNAGLLHSLESLVNDRLPEFEKQCINKVENRWELDKKKIVEFPGGRYLLFEALKEFGINNNEFEKVVALMEKQAGKEVITRQAKFINDRGMLYVLGNTPGEIVEQSVFEGQTKAEYKGYCFEFAIINSDEKLITRKPNEAFLNYEAIEFPLKIRSWQRGDSFQPYGMHGTKKLSDYFIDKKLPSFEKVEIPVVEESGGNIIWIVGHTIDDHYKIDKNCTKILKIVAAKPIHKKYKK